MPARATRNRKKTERSPQVEPVFGQVDHRAEDDREQGGDDDPSR